MNYSSANQKYFNNNYIRIISGLVAVLLAGLVVNGCGDSLTGSTNTEENFVSSSNSQSPKAKKTDNIDWREQFDKGSTIANKKLQGTGVKMTGYNFVEKVPSQQSLDSFFQKLSASQSYFPVYDQGNLKSLTLVQKNNLKKSKNKLISYRIKKLKAFLDKREKKGLGKVKVNWDYRGKKISTLAIVHEKTGLVYDNIISNTLTFKQTTDTTIIKRNNNENLTRSGISRLKTNSVEDPGGGDCDSYPCYYTKVFYNRIDHSNMLGAVGYAEARFMVDGVATGNHSGNIFSTSNQTDCDTYQPFTSCNVKTKLTDNIVNQDNSSYVRLAYGMYVSGSISGLNITFDGTGFEITGAGGGDRVAAGAWSVSGAQF